MLWKSRYQKKIKYFHYSSNKRVDFFVSDRGMFELHIHKDMLRKNLFLSTTTDFNKKNLLFHT
jgi:hypothetical protein